MNPPIDEMLILKRAIELEARPSLLDPQFPHQCAFIEDPSKLKALFCTRRAAKSYTGGLGLLRAAEDYPGCNTLYLGLTRLSAKGIIWKDVFKEINRRKNLDLHFNETELTATSKNGSITYVTGVDATEDEMEKLLGKKYKRIVIDEAASYTIDLRKLIYGVLKPTTIDHDGDIWITGTAGNLTRGLFFDITNGREPGWKLFEWGALDNPYIARQWRAELEDIAKNRPLFMQTTLFRQWYLNEWVVDEEKLVYRYKEGLNDYDALPYYLYGKWDYVLGVDLGYEDDSAFTVCAFHENDATLYIVETFKKSKMDITDVANQIKFYQTKYPLIYKVIMDGANKQAVQEMQNRHAIAITAADKTGKSDFIEIMNAEFVQGKIKLNRNLSKDLVEEYQGLVWNLEGDKIAIPRKENEQCPNHLSDATLYAWRYTYSFLSRVSDPKINLRDRDQYLKHTQKLVEDQLQRQIDREEAEEKGDVWGLPEDPFDQEAGIRRILNQRRGRG